MIAIDVDGLRRKSPQERLEAIQDFRKRIDEALTHANRQAQERIATLNALEEEADRELAIITRVEIPKDKEVNVKKLFKPKTLEGELESARAEQPKEDLLRTAYDFGSRNAYERIANLRDKVASGEKLTAPEKQAVQYYGDLMQTLHTVKRDVKDEDTKEVLTRSERALKQIQHYWEK
ncbi:hypothetical protein HY492_00955 [Candidatus Woesearchaeota archaeon]|nr:hypothetical protein [Candidatus Woesearchaeota archaeon]